MLRRWGRNQHRPTCWFTPLRRAKAERGGLSEGEPPLKPPQGRTMGFFQTAESCNPVEKWSFTDATNADQPGIPTAVCRRSATRSGPTVHVGGSAPSTLGASKQAGATSHLKGDLSDRPGFKPDPRGQTGCCLRDRVSRARTHTCSETSSTPVSVETGNDGPTGFPARAAKHFVLFVQPTIVCRDFLKMDEPDAFNRVQNNVPNDYQARWADTDDVGKLWSGTFF